MRISGITCLLIISKRLSSVFEHLILLLNPKISTPPHLNEEKQSGELVRVVDQTLIQKNLRVWRQEIVLVQAHMTISFRCFLVFSHRRGYHTPHQLHVRLPASNGDLSFDQLKKTLVFWWFAIRLVGGDQRIRSNNPIRQSNQTIRSDKSN